MSVTCASTHPGLICPHPLNSHSHASPPCEGRALETYGQLTGWLPLHSPGSLLQPCPIHTVSEHQCPEEGARISCPRQQKVRTCPHGSGHAKPPSPGKRVRTKTAASEDSQGSLWWAEGQRKEGRGLTGPQVLAVNLSRKHCLSTIHVPGPVLVT